LGCIALTDEEIDELYNAVKIGTPILIKPWKMNRIKASYNIR
jgi:lipoprotein-anchoring transpeptidase ErfK/SrfK